MITILLFLKLIHASGTEWKCRQKQLVLENEEEGENETLVEKSYDEEEKEKENPLNEKRVERSNDKENKNPPNEKPVEKRKRNDKEEKENEDPLIKKPVRKRENWFVHQLKKGMRMKIY